MVQRSAKWYRAIRASLKRRWRTKAWQDKMRKAVSSRAAQKKRDAFWNSPEAEQAKKNRSEAAIKTAKRNLSNPKWRKKMSNAQKRSWRNPERKRKQRLVSKRTANRQWKSVKHRKLMLRSVHRQWEDPKFVEKMLRACACGHATSRPQKSFFRKLCCGGVSGVKLEYHIGTYSVDIAHLPTKTAIEIDGEYWHKGKDHSKRDKYLRDEGWKVIHIPLLHNKFSDKQYNKVLGVLK
jgi:very-short-patch-repair endonuclease